MIENDHRKYTMFVVHILFQKDKAPFHAVVFHWLIFLKICELQDVIGELALLPVKPFTNALF